MRRTLVRQLEAEMERHTAEIDRLANERVKDFVREWKRTRKGPCELIFGIGTMAAEGPPDKYSGSGWSKILEDLDRDLDEITNGFRAGCPDNVKIN
jgi:hypothetical protein